ncbi:MAG: HAD superfamily hydrolase (TIGR01509 family) [Ascidiaceihabitans sp.]|jgi:HAD superfamily hydrolase (TIGR01509 family)
MIPKMVIFDCDGVLVDSETLGNCVLRQNLADHGLDLPLEQVMATFVGGTMVGVMKRAREMGAALPDDWLKLVYADIYDVLGRSVEVIPHVPNLLDALDNTGIVYAVGSNGPMRKMEITLGRTGLWDRLVGRVYTSYDCAAPKPAPDVYLKAAHLAGIDPSDCVVIEDSATGARAAVAANMSCFGYCAETAVDLMTPHCVATFDDMRELPKLLGLQG